MTIIEITEKEHLVRVMN